MKHLRISSANTNRTTSFRFSPPAAHQLRQKPEVCSYVANILAQHDIRRHGDVPPIRYEALRQGLARVRERALALGATIHAPRIGCGLAGGSWNMIEPLIREELSAHDLCVTIYDLPTNRR